MKPVNAGQAAAYALVDELYRCGVRHAFLAPGSRSSPLAYAFADAKMSLTVCIDERSAAFMALGASKISGTPAVVACTSGTAAANLHPAVIEADMSFVPLVVLTADRPPELRETGAGQTIDQVKLFGSAVRWFFDPGVPEARASTNELFRSVACRAFAEATGPPGGPVHLNLQSRDPLVPEPDADGFPFSAEGRKGGRPWSTHPRPKVLPDVDALAEIARIVARTEEGLVIAGSGILVPEAVVDLAKAAGWPLIAEPTSGARVEAAISCSEALLRSRFGRDHVPRVVLKIGSITTSKLLLAHIADAQQITLAEHGAWHDPNRTSSAIVTGDVSESCFAIAGGLAEPRGTGWLAEWSAAERTARSVIDEELDGMVDVCEPRLARDLARSIPDAGLLFVASSMPIRDLDWFMSPREGITIRSNRGANGIDGTTSSAIGASLVHQGPTFALMGDLAFLHDQGAFLASRDARPDLVIVVVNNDGGGIFSFLPQAEREHFEQLFGTPHGADLSALCSAHGVFHRKVEAPDDLARLSQEAAGMPGIKVIEAVTDRGANVTVHRRLWEAVSDRFG